MLRCIGSVNDTAPCPHRPLHQVTSRSQAQPLPVCKYHLYDAVDDLSSQGFPAVVIRIAR